MPKSKVRYLLHLGIISLVVLIPEIYCNAQSTGVPISPPPETLPNPPKDRVTSTGVPTIIKVDPKRLLVKGGTIITITGTNFATDAKVKFGQALASSVVLNTTTIKVLVPKGTDVFPKTVKPGSTNVTITTEMTSAPYGIVYVAPKFCCWLFPTVGMRAGDATVREKNINNFYNGLGSLTFFDQIKSIYNGASSSTTISADLTTLNFSNGMQMTAGTNLQAGSSGATTTVAPGAIPTLAASGAAQAAQNMIFGGNFVVRAVLPVVAAGIQPDSLGGIGGTMNFVLQEGVDLQNFKAGTSTTVDSPPSHSAAQMEGYLVYNSINLAPGTDSKSNIYAGQIFIGGSYGYSYSSHPYARDYGFGSVHRGVGQASAGILINKVAKISVSRGFGPSQTYIDGTSMARTTVNNFKSWSFGITYQSAPKPNN